MSWGGRGREDETRERMIDAARRSGMSVSELVRALAEDSAAPPRDKAPRRSRSEPVDDRWDHRDRPPEPSRTGDIDHQLDVLADRLRSLSAGGERVAPRSRSRERAGETTLDEIAAAVDRLSRQIPEPQPKRTTRAQPKTDVSAVLAALDGLDRRVKAMTEEKAETGRNRRSSAVLGDLDRTIAEISQRQTTLDKEKRTRRATGDGDIERHFRELSEKIEQLRARDERNSPEALIEEIRSLRQVVEQRAAGVDVGEEIRKLAGRIDAMAAHDPHSAALEPLMTEMGRLRDVVLQSDVEGSLKSLEAGYGHIVDRLDDLKRGLASPRVGASVDAEISEIRNLLRAVPQVSQFSSIDQSLRDLAGKVERLSQDEEDTKTSRVEKRISELKSQIDRIDPAPVIKALDQRLKLVTDKLDAIEKEIGRAHV
jgi:localization factor PodJL